MKKQSLLICTLLVTLLSGQSNEALKREFANQHQENNKKFKAYVAKRYGSLKKAQTPEVQKQIEMERETLAGFYPDGRPYFYKTRDINQVKNTNSDFIQNGSISGLSGSFNGEGIKYTIFDAGNVFTKHTSFSDSPNSIINKENPSSNYRAHATEVAGVIKSKSYTTTTPDSNNQNTKINTQGIAKNSTMDVYSFLNTVLPGRTDTLSVIQKILIAEPKISNHSYGNSTGWIIGILNQERIRLWEGSFESPNTYYDLHGVYYTDDKSLDQIVYNNPSYIIVFGIGNEYGKGPYDATTSGYRRFYYNEDGTVSEFKPTDTIAPNNCGSGYDCASAGSLAKNIIAVGATDIIYTNDGRYKTSSDVVHASYSSAGPRDDGGIKPDITAAGTNIGLVSTAEDSTGSSIFNIANGTSYSAPAVTGIIGLWTQINKKLFNNKELDAASAKTLMIHSAAEAGNIGPDPWYGWGLIDAKKGAELLVGKSNNTVLFDDEILKSGIKNEKTVRATGNEPLKVTISWIDPAYKNVPKETWKEVHNNRTSVLVNDLDLRIIDTTTNTTYYPWKLNANSPLTPATKADNTVDNVEQVVIDSPVAGRTYKVVISNKGTLVNDAGASSPQNYSIIISGYTENTNKNSLESPTQLINTIVIAPTITKDFVKILKAPKQATFNIYDLTGKKLQSGIINTNEASLDMSSYTKGIYIIEVKTDKEVITKKVIKE